MKRVLIVDDAIELGRLLQDTLKSVHPEITVSVVPSAEEALLVSSYINIDLLVTDLRLPGMSGLELIRKVRLRQPAIRVIMMTGLSNDDRLVQQKDEAKADIFIHKPITAGVFIEAVDRLIDEGPPASGLAPNKPDSEQEAVLREMASVLPGEPVPAKARTAPLRKGTGGLKLPAVQPPATAEEGLSAVLTRLRGSLGAHSAILLDERGRPVAQAGDLPDLSFEEQLVPPMMASLSAAAKISYLLGQETIQSVHAYRGAGLDLVIAPVGQYTLLLSLRSDRSVLRLAIAFEEALNAQAELSAALESMGLHIQQAGETGAPEALLTGAAETEEGQVETVPPEILATPLGQDPGLEKFEELFTRKKTGQLHLQDPDAFWDQATGGGAEVSQPGVLSFDQAQKLGLMPDEKKSPG